MSNKSVQIKTKNLMKSRTRQAPSSYDRFDELDGRHPWQEQVPEGFISYPVRELGKGKIAYFNFRLAKEMGLIPQDHDHKLNRSLEKKLIETFSIRIVNEYDQVHDITFPESSMKKHKYMATRYLQLQHSDKTGRTSGDGRCVWNGSIEYKGTTWDVSSRGTGVTALAPGAVQAGKPLRSGNTDFGYGCGLAEIDELYGAALMAEILHSNGLNTERVLAIIDHGDGIGIGVRAGQNLFRPAHLFMHLKQKNYEALKRATDFLIQRQHQNKEWRFSTRHPQKYQKMLEEICESFAQFAAHLERDYIFAWLDWDGDNVLANAGIIDYGSVRQFGLRHDQYRYDDVQRFSTNLNEQRGKAKLTVQVYAQLIDYLKTGERKPLNHFKKHPILKKFDQDFQYFSYDRLLFQLGFKQKTREYLLRRHRRAVKSFFDNFSYFERVKTYKKMTKVADGVNRPAIFNMRNILRELPLYFLEHSQSFSSTHMDAYDFFQIIKTVHMGRKDKRLSERLKKRIQRFQTQYKSLIQKAAQNSGQTENMLAEVTDRAAMINRENRITGNALINIVGEIIYEKKQGLSDEQIQKVIDKFIWEQSLDPDRAESRPNIRLQGARRSRRLMDTMLRLVEGHKEDI